jgi:uncharacterized protein YjfI (DUF2170 family)
MADPIVSKTVCYTVDWAALADAVEQRATAKLEEDVEKWRGDRSMRAMIMSDYGDTLSVCEVIETGRWRDIEERLWEMDTAARECVYDFIEAELGMSWNEFTAGMPQ